MRERGAPGRGSTQLQLPSTARRGRAPSTVTRLFDGHVVDNRVSPMQGETVVAQPSGSAGHAWVMLAYRVPREPSSPRIAIWRRLKRLGVAQVGDGLVALPADPRTIEALEWVANDVLASGGQGSVWSARPLDRATEAALVAEMRAARAAEYADLQGRVRALAEAAPTLSDAEQARRLKALRAEVRKVQRRDFFPPPLRDEVTAGLRELRGRFSQNEAGRDEAGVRS